MSENFATTRVPRRGKRGQKKGGPTETFV